MILKEKYAKGELAKDILVAIAVTGFIVTCAAMPGLAYIFTLFKPKSARDRGRIRQSVKQLQKRKLVRIYQKNDKDVVEITESGKKKLLEYKLDDMKIRRPKKWDGLYRIIIFDIPEKKRRARSEVSSLLNSIGAVTIQKSTFLSPFECRDEIDFIGEYYGVRKNIIYLVAKDIDISSQIKKKFSL